MIKSKKVRWIVAFGFLSVTSLIVSSCAGTFVAPPASPVPPSPPAPPASLVPHPPAPHPPENNNNQPPNDNIAPPSDVDKPNSDLQPLNPNGPRKDGLLIRSQPASSNYISNDSNYYQLDYNAIKSPDGFFHARAYPQNPQINFDDLFERKVVNDNYFINNQLIPTTTKRIQYNVLNKVFTTTRNGYSFNTWDLEGNNPNNLDTPSQSNTEDTVPNDTYRKLLRYSVSLSFDNIYDKPGMPPYSSKDSGDLKIGINEGTGWILDYQVPEPSNVYPTVWYFATNLHVARALSSKSSYAPYQYNPKTNIITKSTTLRYYPIGSGSYDNALGNVGSGASIGKGSSSQSVNVDAKLLYTAKDFLKSQPHDFFPDYFPVNTEEYADFAVFETTFKTEAEARAATQDYYHETAKFRFRSQSYLSERNLWKAPDFYSGGYPVSSSTWPIATNKSPSENAYTNKDLDSQIANQGSPFTNQTVLSTFSNYEGINDGLLGLSGLDLTFWGEKIILSGLVYAIRHDAMRGGSSGSMVLNNQNEVIGLHFADWDKVDVGLSTALKSERFLYNNLPGYYVPDYDLIYGGGLDQKSSYKAALKAALATRPNVKTYLFPQGLQ